MRVSTRFAAVTALLSAVATLPASATETKTYTYDALGRLVVVVNDDHDGNASDDKVRSYCYDAAGNRIEFVSDDNGTPDACVEQG